MDEGRPAPSNDAPAPGALAALGICALAAGLALGLIQPLAVVSIGAGLVAGPTYLGLLFGLCVLGALLMGGVAFFGGRWFTVPVFVVCGSMALGMIGGNWVAASLDIGFASDRADPSGPSGRPSGETIALPHGWTGAGSMTAPRTGHTATLLADGRVLVAGGHAPDYGEMATAELYDPIAGTWTPTGSMLAAQAEHTAVLLADGRVLVLSAWRPEAEIYDPVAGAWELAGARDMARRGATATLLPDGRVLVAGGLDPDRGEPLASAELFDPVLGRWSRTGVMGAARAAHTATLLPDGRVLVAGGTTTRTDRSGPADPMLASAELFDPETGAWSAAPPMQAMRSGHAAASLAAGSVLVAGGMAIAPGPRSFDEVEIYDPTTRTWHAGGAGGTWGPITLVPLPDGQVLMAGMVGSLQLYDARTGTSRSIWNPHKATSGAAVTLLADGRVLVTGGVLIKATNVGLKSDYLASAHVYDPPTPVPAPMPTVAPLPAPAANVGAAVAARVAAFVGAVPSATKAIPPAVPAARKVDESLESYAKRAADAARAAAGPLRDLAGAERQWLDGLDAASCPLVAEYGTFLNAYWIVAQAIWTAEYGADAALLEQARADLVDLGTTGRASVQEISGAPEPCVERFEPRVGALSSRVIGTQSHDITRDTGGLRESAVGNLVADAMHHGHPDAAVALVNAGGLRADLLVAPSNGGEQPGEITWGEMLLALPFGNRAVVLSVTGDQLEAALRNGLAPACDPDFSGGAGRFPQLSGLKVEFACDGVAPVITGMWTTPDGARGLAIPVRPADTVRLVTVDYLAAGGDGYSMFEAAADVRAPGATLVDIVIDYLAAESPVGPLVERRIVGP